MIRVDRKLNSIDVNDAFTDLFILRGSPEYIGSDNGTKFIANKVRDWVDAVGAKTTYFEPGSQWENSYCESFNARFSDELLNGEFFYSLREAQILIELWQIRYNTIRSHSSPWYSTPAPESIIKVDKKLMMRKYLTWSTQWGRSRIIGWFSFTPLWPVTNLMLKGTRVSKRKVVLSR